MHAGGCTLQLWHGIQKASFNETGNLEIVSHQLKNTWFSSLLAQSCSCGLVIYWEVLGPVAFLWWCVVFFSVTADI